MLTQDSIGRDFVLKTGVVITIIAEIQQREYNFAGYAYEFGINSPIYFWNAEGEFENQQFADNNILRQVVALPFTKH